MKRSLSIAACAFLMAGCGMFGGGKPATPEPLRIEVAASTRLNPDDHGESLPTLVRVYQLTNAARARTVELRDLIKDPKAVLGDDLLSVEELLLSPGQRIDRVLQRDQQTRAILVAAVVRRPAATTWREIVELSSKKNPTLSYVLEEYRLSRR